MSLDDDDEDPKKELRKGIGIEERRRLTRGELFRPRIAVGALKVVLLKR
jgi:hypothetical protein